MDSKEHQKLADIIKGVHQKLRKALYTSGDHNKVWTEHLKQLNLRQKYSSAMLKLATEAWKGKECRIEWTYDACMNYFYNGGLERSLTRQWRKSTHLQKQFDTLNVQECHNFVQQNSYRIFNEKLKLLDVGSCYNPFSKYEEFCCVAIDLTPATEDVLQLDFLKLDVQPKLEDHNECSDPGLFCSESFDIVVLSLVLEYLPAPQQRAMFIYKSWQLLKDNGLLIIITPDSKSMNRNVHMIKSWKLALEKISFVRVKYNKLQHIHCMAFRKMKTENGSAIDAIQMDLVSELLFIPQDFKNYKEDHIISVRTEEESNIICNNFQELPYEDLF